MDTKLEFLRMEVSFDMWQGSLGLTFPRIWKERRREQIIVTYLYHSVTHPILIPIFWAALKNNHNITSIIVFPSISLFGRVLYTCLHMFTSCLQRSTWNVQNFRLQASPEGAKFHFVRTDAVQLAITGPHPLVPPQRDMTNWTKNQCNPATMPYMQLYATTKSTKSVGNDVIKNICPDVDSEAPYVHHVQTTIWKTLL